LISAEGKNPDIVEALVRVRRHSARAIHVLTNRAHSPLTDCIAQLSDISTHLFELGEKDGYLATNSLLLDAVLVARAYGELGEDAREIPRSLESLTLLDQTIDEWLGSAEPFVKTLAARGALIVTYSPLLRSIAADLESKLAEAALLHCQVADLRSLAHGRHLWFADRPNDCAVLALVEPTLTDLWSAMRGLLPDEIPTLTMQLGGARPGDLLSGLVAAMRFVSAVAGSQGKDPGRPVVPQFGRDLYYVDLPRLTPKPVESEDGGEQSKYNVLGARWPSVVRRGSMRRAVASFRTDIERQVFHAIVFDYDGTLCSSQRDEKPPPDSVVRQIRRLLDANVVVGIASGRGGSIQEALRASLPDSVWHRVPLALYSGGWITRIGDPPHAATETSEFLSHVARIVHRLKALGVPIERIRPTHPFQVSVRFREGLQTEGMWFVIADALRQAGLDLSRMVRSKHSVDILAPGVDKSRLIAHIVQEFKVAPYQVLTVGDQGAWPGNDCSLLEHRYSLSVDSPSRRLDRGWKLAPPHKRDVDATFWYLERLQVMDGGCFRLVLDHTSDDAS
jgi:hypothetical protein